MAFYAQKKGKTMKQQEIQEFVKWLTKGKRMTPHEANEYLINFLESKNCLKNWIIFGLIIALIFSHT